MKQTVTPWRAAPWLFGLLALAALILVVRRVGELARFAQLARGAKPEWLLLALALQLATYVCTASVWRSSLAGAGAPYSLRSLIHAASRSGCRWCRAFGLRDARWPRSHRQLTLLRSHGNPRATLPFGAERGAIAPLFRASLQCPRPPHPRSAS